MSAPTLSFPSRILKDFENGYLLVSNQPMLMVPLYDSEYNRPELSTKESLASDSYYPSISKSVYQAKFNPRKSHSTIATTVIKKGLRIPLWRALEDSPGKASIFGIIFDSNRLTVHSATKVAIGSNYSLTEGPVIERKGKRIGLTKKTINNLDHQTRTNYESTSALVEALHRSKLTKLSSPDLLTTRGEIDTLLSTNEVTVRRKIDDDELRLEGTALHKKCFEEDRSAVMGILLNLSKEYSEETFLQNLMYDQSIFKTDFVLQYKDYKRQCGIQRSKSFKCVH